MQNGCFPSKLAISFKNVCYKVFCAKTDSNKVVKAFISLTIRAKMIGGGDPFDLKFWVELAAFERNRQFPTYFGP